MLYIICMTLEDIQKAVAELSRDQLAEFSRWFAEFDAGAWDREIKEDVKPGKLDKLAERRSPICHRENQAVVSG